MIVTPHDEERDPEHEGGEQQHARRRLRRSDLALVDRSARCRVHPDGP